MTNELSKEQANELMDSTMRLYGKDPKEKTNELDNREMTEVEWLQKGTDRGRAIFAQYPEVDPEQWADRLAHENPSDDVEVFAEALIASYEGHAGFGDMIAEVVTGADGELYNHVEHFINQHPRRAEILEQMARERLADLLREKARGADLLDHDSCLPELTDNSVAA